MFVEGGSPTCRKYYGKEQTGGNDNFDGGVNVSALPKGEKLVLTSGAPIWIIASVTLPSSGHPRTS